MDYTYCFKLFPEIINQYSYKYKFFDTVEKKKKKKKNRDCEIYSPYLQFIGKGFSFEREVIKSKPLVVRLSEDNKDIKPFVLHRNPNHPMQYLTFLLRRNFYRDISLYFTYDTQYKKWFTKGTDFFIKQWLK